MIRSAGHPHGPRLQPHARAFGTLGALRLDLKLGVRMLLKYPGLTLVGVFGIAVAVAIATAGFSMIYGNFLAPSLPFEEGDRIVSLEIWDSAANKPERRVLHDYNAWRDQLKSIEEIGAFRMSTPNLIAPGARPQSVRVASITASGFRVARVRPLIGRHLADDDEREGAPSVIVIGESVWRNRFGADPGILGQSIQLGGTPHAIVGVMPESFAFPINDRFWVPLRLGAATPAPLTGGDLMVFGRLAPGVTREAAQAELSILGRRAAGAFPKIYAQLQPQVLPYANPFLGIHQAKDAAGLHLLHGMVTMLLLLVCLNVAVLVYTRTAMRQAEIAVRTALGASRGRIVTQLFLEALVLSAVGTASGVAAAAFGLRRVAAAVAEIASQLPFWLTFHLSPQAILYAGVLSVLAAAIVGIVPALQATKRGLQTDGRVIGAGGMRLGKTWTTLVVAQVAFAVTLLPAAVFNAVENLRAEMVDPGVAAGEFLTARLGLDEAANLSAGTQEFARRYAGLQTELMRRLEADSQVGSVTFAMALPGEEPAARIETQAPASTVEPAASLAAPGGTAGHEVGFNRVDVHFFRALDVPILAGRGFEPADLAGAGAGLADIPAGGTVVVNQSLAQRVFAGDALGRRIRYTGKSTEEAESGPWYEIVGIVRDFPAGVSPGMLDSPLRLYHPAAAGQVQPVAVALRVRAGAPSAFSNRLSEIASAIDPGLQVTNIVSLDEALHKEQWIRRLEAAVLAAVSLGVLLLSSAGIYALMSFTVSQRRKEIGIRMALGANRTRIVAGIFSRALGQLGVGATLGVAAAAVLESSSGGSMMRGSAVFVLPAVALFMMAVGFAAALGAARRCLGIEPTEALREQ